MGNVYKEFKYVDGLLYIVFSKEKIWGWIKFFYYKLLINKLLIINYFK
jgi:hypothetical protein